MSIGEIFSAAQTVLDVGFDLWWLRDGVRGATKHGWGHLSTQAATRKCSEHVRKAEHADYRFQIEYGNYDTIKPDAARKMRSEASALLRENKFYQTVVKMKIPKVSRKYSGDVEKTFLTGYREGQDKLTDIEKNLKIRLQEIDARHPASKSQKLFQNILNVGSKIQRTSYEHRVSSGVLFASAVIILPLYCLYRDVSRLKNPPKKQK